MVPESEKSNTAQNTLRWSETAEVPNSGIVNAYLTTLECSPVRYVELLSEGERERANRFHQQRHRDRFAVGRGKLRAILGECLGIDPSELEFEYGEFGKPSIGSDIGFPLQFNVAHSGEWLLVGICADCPIGVDIERARQLSDLESMASTCFVQEELDNWNRLADSRLDGFFKLWTCKEAVLKALGTGLSLPLRNLCVSLTTSDMEPAVRIDRSPHSDLKWSLECMQPVHNYWSTVAIPQEGFSVRWFLWNG